MRYNVIYADPPWSYENKSVVFEADGVNRAVSEQYGLMSMSEIMNMPIKSLTEKDAVCFMWVVNPLLQEGMDTMNAWGFKYKTMVGQTSMKLIAESIARSHTISVS